MVSSLSSSLNKMNIKIKRSKNFQNAKRKMQSVNPFVNSGMVCNHIRIILKKKKKEEQKTV